MGYDRWDWMTPQIAEDILAHHVRVPAGCPDPAHDACVAKAWEIHCAQGAMAMLPTTKRRFFWGHTWLGWLNLLVFQWFGVRFQEEVTVPEGRHLYWHFGKEKPLRGWS